jgi:MFS family permease
MAGFTMAAPASLVIGAPISALILQADWFNLAGWRWMFILEGLPAVVFGVIIVFFLTDHPRQAKWLEPDERDWIASRLDSEKQALRRVGHLTVMQGLRQRNVLFLALALPTYPCLPTCCGAYNDSQCVRLGHAIDDLLGSAVALAMFTIPWPRTPTTRERKFIQSFRSLAAVFFVWRFLGLSAVLTCFVSRVRLHFPGVSFWVILAVLSELQASVGLLIW